MTAYEVDYSYKNEVSDSVVVDADTVDEAEISATGIILDANPEISIMDLNIDSIKEIK